MAGTHHSRLGKLPQPKWLARCNTSLRRLVEGHVDGGVESAAALHRRFNLIRFCPARTFRYYVAKRRALIAEYRLRNRTAYGAVSAGRGGGQ